MSAARKPLGRTRIAIVGAGFAGLACARELVAREARVTVFERGRSVGGRVATLASACGPFDHAAQYFTVHHHRFEVTVQEWCGAGLAAPWRCRLVVHAGGRVEAMPSTLQRYVGVPTMGVLAQQLARGIEVQREVRVSRVHQVDGGWRLHDERGRDLALAPFDAVLLATPSQVAADLLGEHPGFEQLARAVQWEPAIAALVGLGQPLGVDFDAAFINDDPILGWAARDDAKPQRPPFPGVAERWVLHARPRWSRENFRLDDAAALLALQRAFAARVGRTLVVQHSVAARWEHAMPSNPLAQTFLWDPQRRIGCAGDWCGGPRVEAAFLSGVALADAVAA